MSGYNLARQMGQYHPDIKVIYMSGYMESDLIRYGIDANDILLIPKPFKPHHLTEAIQSVLMPSPALIYCVPSEHRLLYGLIRWW